MEIVTDPQLSEYRSLAFWPFMKMFNHHVSIISFFVPPDSDSPRFFGKVEAQEILTNYMQHNSYL